jgi:hypothetical protein
MCDYSLGALRTRLAVEGEALITYRFPTGSLGLTSPAELETHKKELRGWRAWFNPREVPCAACIPPGARLLLRDIPGRIQAQLAVGDTEEVVFIQTSAEEWTHRDGLRFKNGQQILLQRLDENQRVDVLSLSSEAPSELEIATGAKKKVALV